MTVAGTVYQECIYRVKDVNNYYQFDALKRLSLSGSTTINIDYRSSSSSGTAYMRNVRLFVFNATCDYAESETRSTTTSTSWQTKTTLTVTPTTGGYYLILASANIDGSSTSYSTEARLATSNGTEIGYSIKRAQDSSSRYTFGVMRQVYMSAQTVYNLQYESKSTSNTAGIGYAHIAAVRLDKFKNSYYAESQTELTPAAAGTYYDAVSKTYTSEAGYHLILGSIYEKSGSTSNYVSWRISQNSNLKNQDRNTEQDTTDYESHFSFVRANLTAGSKTDKIQYCGGTTSARVKNPRILSIQLAVPVVVNYRIDLEYQWTAADYGQANKQVCVYVNSHTGTEGLKVQYYTGSSWTDLGTISATGWSNFTATGLTSSTYTIRLLGATETSDTSQDSWNIDYIGLHTWTAHVVNYQLNVKFGWTSADYGQVNKKVTFYVTSHTGTENLLVQEWNGAWQSLGTISATGWTNFTANYLTAANYTIRIIGSTESGDTAQDSWSIDYIGLHTWTDHVANYQVNVEFNWANARYNATTKVVCIYVTSHTGTEALNVQYWGTSWQSLGTITTTGWSNFTAVGLTSASYKIRIIGATESGDTSQDTWNIDYIALRTYTANYQLNVKFDWTNADYGATTKTLSVYVGSHTGSEALSIQYWNGNSWQSLGTLSSTGWTNVTALGMTGSNYTIRFVETSESSDSSQDRWSIDCILLHTSTSGLQTIDKPSNVAQVSDIRTSGTKPMVIVARGDLVYAKLNSTMGKAKWAVGSEDVAGRTLIVRWRYTALTAPPANSYRLTLEHDGVNSTVIDLLGGAGQAGTSNWIVKSIQSDSYGAHLLTAVYLECTSYAMHIDYIGVTDGGFATSGEISPSSWTGTLGIVPYGYTVTAGGAPNASMMFDKVDIPLTSDVLMTARVFLQNAASSLIVRFYGISGVSSVPCVAYAVTGTQNGWSDIVLNVSQIVTTMTVITGVELIVTGTSSLLGLDSLWVGRYDNRIESNTDYFEIGNKVSGVTVYGFTGLSHTVCGSSLSVTSANSTAQVSVYVGNADFTKTGPATQQVAYLADGVPPSIVYQPRPGLLVYTTGHDLNLYVKTDTVNFTIGESDGRIVLDSVNITSNLPYQLEFTLYGWCDTVSVNRTFIVSSSGMINWTTYYGSGVNMQSVSVWQQLEDTPLVHHINTMETATNVTTTTMTRNLASSLTEGHNAVWLTANTAMATADLATGLSLSGSDYWDLHLSVRPMSSAMTFYVMLVLSNGSIAYHVAPDGGLGWQVRDHAGTGGSDIAYDVLTEMTITPWTLNGNISGAVVSKVSIELQDAGTSIIVDDLRVSTSPQIGLPELSWKVINATDTNWYSYLASGIRYKSTRWNRP